MKKICFLVSVCVVVLTGVCRADEASPIYAALASFAENGKIPGIVSVVWKNGVKRADCVGYADLATRRPMTENSLFWIASQTKAIGAVTFLTLLDEKKVSLDDPVEKYLPEFATVRVKDGKTTREPKSKMTLRQILSHTSGLPFFPAMPIDARPVRLLASIGAKTPLESDPGTQYRYSNWGIDVAMAVLEVVTEQPFEKVMKERVLDPLEMKDATFFPNDEQMARLATSYRFDQGTPVAITVNQLQFPYSLHTRYTEAGGGLFATPSDLLKFYAMLANGGTGLNGKRILSPETFAELTRKQTPEAVKNPYSFGLHVGDGTVSHGGAYQTWGEANWRAKSVRLYLVQYCGGNQDTGACRKAWDRVTSELPTFVDAEQMKNR
ncbi:MAG: beta-lactamase family protein [Kiritimatiellae bacterium]|nr:beta-lactamase family protein [Kiritimatiellia bacterium]